MPATHPQSWQSGRWWGRRDEMVSCEAVVHEHGHPMCVNIVRGCPVVYCVVITRDRVLKTMCEAAMSRLYILSDSLLSLSTSLFRTKAKQHSNHMQSTLHGRGQSSHRRSVRPGGVGVEGRADHVGAMMHSPSPPRRGLRVVPARKGWNMAVYGCSACSQCVL